MMTQYQLDILLLGVAIFKPMTSLKWILLLTTMWFFCMKKLDSVKIFLNISNEKKE